eukprot:TRINITY_DN31916_c0_g1_i2.p1 TRINITY_DN31916_c0_g1~~TRINITY_DN31916_c0_g1_i2.p1  ORF type:complete len:412 (-),score=47.50 TRINITY_DN31916_c0_g1_i2:671-1846(-)
MDGFGFIQSAQGQPISMVIDCHEFDLPVLLSDAHWLMERLLGDCEPSIDDSQDRADISDMLRRKHGHAESFAIASCKGHTGIGVASNIKLRKRGAKLALAILLRMKQSSPLNDCPDFERFVEQASSRAKVLQSQVNEDLGAKRRAQSEGARRRTDQEQAQSQRRHLETAPRGSVGAELRAAARRASMRAAGAYARSTSSSDRFVCRRGRSRSRRRSASRGKSKEHSSAEARPRPLPSRSFPSAIRGALLDDAQRIREDVRRMREDTRRMQEDARRSVVTGGGAGQERSDDSPSWGPTVFEIVGSMEVDTTLPYADGSKGVFVAFGDLVCSDRYIMVQAHIANRQFQRAPLHLPKIMEFPHMTLAKFESDYTERQGNSTVWRSSPSTDALDI